jgi:hypothetical protein
MKSKKPSIPREPQNLSLRYGEIGISAVAAAMRYQGEDKSPSMAAGTEPRRALGDMVPEGAWGSLTRAGRR